MRQDFVCYNSDCQYLEVTRVVTLPTLGEGIIDSPNPVCVCGWGMGAVSGIYPSPPAE